jgi:signal transduction histidine kinase
MMNAATLKREYTAPETTYDVISPEFKEQIQSEAIRQLARTLQHEINNRLAVIQGSACMVRIRAASGEECEHYLDNIESCCQSIAQILQQLHRVQRIVCQEQVGFVMLDLERSAQDVHGR